MSNITELKPVQTVQNIINKFCWTIGMLPTSYKESLTYEEQLISIGNYLETTVIPALNNNAKAVNELQKLFLELKNYVDNFFEDLNLQEQINNKLDEMAQSGELQNVITNYINLNGVISFPTLNDALNNQALINGSTFKTLGNVEYNDGNGRFYKIVELETTPTTPDYHSLNRDNLYAQEITENYLIDIQTINQTLANTFQVYNNVTELKATTLTSGKVILLGYFNAYDNLPLIYNIETEGINDGGSSILLNNGLYANTNLSGEITPETFGISENDSEEESIEKWTTYSNFVNKNKTCSFKLQAKTYTLYAPIQIGASFKGMGRQRTFINVAPNIKSITLPVGENDQLSESRSCAFYYSSHNNQGQMYTISDFTLNCQDNCDCGIFMGYGAFYTTHQIEIFNSNYSAIRAASGWNCKWSMIFISITNGIGVYTGSDTIGMTTQNFQNVVINGNGTANRGFYMISTHYSTLQDCGCDHFKLQSYLFQSCKSLSGSIGCENSNLTEAYYFNGGSYNLTISASQITANQLITIFTNTILDAQVNTNGNAPTYLINCASPKSQFRAKLNMGLNPYTSKNWTTGTAGIDSLILITTTTSIFYAQNTLTFKNLLAS